MEFFQWGTDPWGQDVLIRASWSLLYAAFYGGLAFVIGHALWKQWFARSEAFAPTGASEGDIAAVPDRVVKYSLAARMFHWIMAASMLVLLFTGFLPIVGIQFAWVTIHWVAGVVLTLSIVYHMVHAMFFLDPWSVWVGPSDIVESMRRLRRQLGGSVNPPPRAGKYKLDNRLYHTAVLITGLGATITGVIMMFRVETPFWTRNPYLLTDQSWGYVYVIHGVCSIGLVTLTMAHIYFAIRPEKLWMTKSMIYGWIGRKDYLEHHDPQRWVVAKASPTEPSRDA